MTAKQKATVLPWGTALNVYLAGPMRGIADLNYPLFNECAGVLELLGARVFNPAQIPGDPSAPWAACMATGLQAVVAWADIVVVLPDWEQSVGATLEVRTAAALGKPVYDIDDVAAAVIDGTSVTPLALPAALLAPFAETTVPELPTIKHRVGPRKERLLIGLIGHKGAGKSTVAEILKKERGYETAAFADVLRWEVYEATHLDKMFGDETFDPFDGHFDAWLAYIEAHKHDDPASPTGWPRRLLQSWGQMRRDQEGEDYWVNQVALRPGLVVSDVRFPNEARAITAAGGVLWVIKRPGYAGDDHASEAHIDNLPWDHLLLNDGSLGALYEDVMRAVDATIAEA